MEQQLITLDSLLNIDDNINAISKRYEKANILLDEKVCDTYDVVEIRKQLIKLFDKFRSDRYFYETSVSDCIRTTSVYQDKIGSSQRSIVSQVDMAVTRYIDSQIWITNFYNSLMLVASKLTHSECVYLIHAFLYHKTEDEIAEKLGSYKTSLQKPKKSCLVKMWIELKMYCENDN